jgi:hypothetical protein
MRVKFSTPTGIREHRIGERSARRLLDVLERNGMKIIPAWYGWVGYWCRCNVCYAPATHFVREVYEALGDDGWKHHIGGERYWYCDEHQRGLAKIPITWEMYCEMGGK